MSDLVPKNLKVTELREELKKRGLSSSGKKDELVKRLDMALSGSDATLEDNENEANNSQIDETNLNTENVSNVENSQPDNDSEKVDTYLKIDEVTSDIPSEDKSRETDKLMEADDQELQESEKAEADQNEIDAPKSENTNLNGENKLNENEIEKVNEVCQREEKSDNEKHEMETDKPEDEQVKIENDEKEKNENDETEKDENDDNEFQVLDQVGEDDATEADQYKKGEKRKRSRSRSRDRHRDRHRRRSPSPLKIEMESDDWLKATNIQLDRYNCDLNIRIDENGCKATPISVEGFALMWAGVRSMYGVNKGKVGFQIKILDDLDVKHVMDEEHKHILRTGWSTDSNSLQLGEEELSYGYDGTAKKCTNSKFDDFGHTFGKDDVITSYVDFDVTPPTILFSKNGDDLGIAFEVEESNLEGKSLFPHILSKNCEFQVNFGELEEPWFPIKEGFQFISNVCKESLTRGSLPPENKNECEMIMMCGLPGAGKTYWTEKYSVENLDKKYNILGTHSIINKMNIMGISRKENFSGRWDALIDKATKCLNRLLEIASRKKRNYILDQTNVYASARKRKMRPFEGFQRKAIVVVPNDEDYKSRYEKRDKEENKEIPDSAVLEMKANFSLPQEGELFDKIEFTELEREEAQKIIEKYNKEARSQLPPPDTRRYRSRDRRDRSGRDRRDYGRRDNYRRDRYRPYDRRGRDDRRGGGYRGGYGGGRGGWNQGGGGGWQGGYGGSSGYSGGGYGGGGGNWGPPGQWGGSHYQHGGSGWSQQSSWGGGSGSWNQGRGGGGWQQQSNFRGRR